MTPPQLRQFPSLASPTSVTAQRNPLGADLAIAEAPERRRFHFPGACRLPDGTLLVVARQGKEHVDPSGIIQLVRSTDDGATWSEPVTVWDSDHDDRDPMVSVGPTGRVHLIFTRTEPQLGDIEAMGVRVMSSDDGGYHWTMPTRLENSRPGWLASHGQVMETASGTLVAPVYGPTWSGISRSLDGGESFPASEQYVFDTNGLATNEVTLTQVDDVLIAWLRPVKEGAPSVLFRSRDDGFTWEGPEPTNVIQSSAAAQPLPDGRLLVAWGDASQRYGQRRVTCVGIVADPLRPWTGVTPVPIWDALNNDQGNPALALLGDGAPLVIVNDYASRQLVGIRMPLATIERAIRDEAQLEGAVDLLAMVRDGRATFETNAPEPAGGLPRQNACLTASSGSLPRCWVPRDKQCSRPRCGSLPHSRCARWASHCAPASGRTPRSRWHAPTANGTPWARSSMAGGWATSSGWRSTLARCRHCGSRRASTPLSARDGAARSRQCLPSAKLHCVDAHFALGNGPWPVGCRT